MAAIMFKGPRPRFGECGEPRGSLEENIEMSTGIEIKRRLQTGHSPESCMRTNKVKGQ